MARTVLCSFCVLVLPLMSPAFARDPGYVIALHGGVGVLPRDQMTAEYEAAYREALLAALEAARQSLEHGGSALDAVVDAIVTMEDSPLFNAGKGSVFTSAGTHELDASIMDGAGLRAGAVAAVTTIKNPIVLARAVMEKSPHVMLIGAGAEAFAREQSIEQVEPDYFYTERRWQELQKAKAKAEKSGGTVGVVVLDSKGHLAAGTSTGGMTNKRWGRVGDSPVIGAGTYADDSTCAVSASGDGEYFIRLAVAHEIRALVKYGGQTLQQAADRVILRSLPALGGTGGVVAVDPHGEVVFSFNTEGMYRGVLREGGPPEVRIYRETD